MKDENPKAANSSTNGKSASTTDNVNKATVSNKHARQIVVTVSRDSGKDNTTKAKIKAKEKISNISPSAEEVGINTSVSVFETMNTNYPSSYQPAVKHALFARDRQLIDPERPLNDFPEPAPRFPKYLTGQNHAAIDKNASVLNNEVAAIDNCWQKPEHMVSKWDLIQSHALAEHIQLLEAGALAKFPQSFYHNNIQQPLLSSISDMPMVGMTEIRQILSKYPNLVRQGWQQPIVTKTTKRKKTKANTVKKVQYSDIDIQNSDYADDWEVILYPHRFDEFGELSCTDIMACSIAKHALQQCAIRKSINHNLSLAKITDSIRSYQLSQCKQLAGMSEQLRRSPIYPGHVIIAALLINLEMQVAEDCEQKTGIAAVHFNLSSRCALFTRYPVLSDYYINGWQ